MLPHRGIKSQTLYLIPPQSHYTDSPSPIPKNLSAKRGGGGGGGTSNIINDFVVPRPGMEPGAYRPRS